MGRGTWRSRIRVGFLSASSVLNDGEPGLPAPGDVPKDIRLRAKIARRCQRQGEMKKVTTAPTVDHLLFAASKRVHRS